LHVSNPALNSAGLNVLELGRTGMLAKVISRMRGMAKPAWFLRTQVGTRKNPYAVAKPMKGVSYADRSAHNGEVKHPMK